MSRHILSRIPPKLRDIFRVYECLSKAYRNAQIMEIKDHLRNTGPAMFMQHLWRMNVTNEHDKIHNSADFPPLISELISPLFEERESKSLKVYFNDLDSGSLISSRNHSFKHFTDYQAKILLNFASALSPYTHVPQARSTINSFRWYKRLLANTPMIFFLKQKQKLMSEHSLLSCNPPYEMLRAGITELSGKYSNSEDYVKRTKNYYFTDLASSDLFRIALASSEDSYLHSLGSKMSYSNDKLCEQISVLQKPLVVDKHGVEVEEDELAAFMDTLPRTSLADEVAKINIFDDVHGFFPYDVVYNDVYMITIEPPIIEDRHDELLQFIRSQDDFDVFAIRLSSRFPLSKPFEQLLTNTNNMTKNFNATYEDLLTWAQTHHESENSKESGVSHLIRTIGEWGLVEVAESSDGDSLYLTKQ